MALYKYVKAPPQAEKSQRLFRMPAFSMPQFPQFQISVNLPRLKLPSLPTPVQKPAYAYSRTISITLGLIGLFMIAWVTYPILSFEIKSRTKFAHNVILPVPASEKTLGWEQVVKMSNSDFAPAVAAAEAYRPESQANTSISSWVPQRQQQNSIINGRIYFLSIPKLGINDATVKIAGENLDESLIHYGGTGLPGEYGNAVIFGHSILPQFYDPTNYKAIFSKLPDLNAGDEILIKYDGLTYKYIVYSMIVKSPTDISILEQRYDNSYITLVTCVPPGTYWKRLEVKAHLVTG